MKRLTAFLISFVLVLSIVSPVLAKTTFNTGPAIYLNGQKLKLSKPAIIVNGRTLVPVRSVFEELGADVEWKAAERKVKVHGDKTSIAMRIGYTGATVNNRLIKMDVAPKLINGTTLVPLRFIAETLNSEVAWNSKTGSVSIKTASGSLSPIKSKDGKQFVVVIDSGHGGRDPGAIYGGIKEKDVNLDIAKRLNKLLKAEGIKTYMTRNGDSTLSLYSRSGLANRVNADLLVSVHNNASINTGAAGSMALYFPGIGNSKGNLTAREFALIVQREMTGALGTRNMGVIPRSSLALLRTANMPAVIAEVGYMSNKQELSMLATNSFKARAAKSLKDAVIESLKQI